MSRHQSRREAGYRKHVPDASPVRTAAGRAEPTTGLPTLRAWARLSLPRNPEERIPATGRAACRHLPVIWSGLVGRRAGSFY